jgi:hypothetical protein
MEKTCREKPSLGISRPTTAASTDVISFLKALLRLVPALTLALGGNPRSSDQVVAAFWRRALLEDTILEFTTCGSPMVV